MNITFREYEVPLGKQVYKILTPSINILDLFVVSVDSCSSIILGNESSLEKFSIALNLASKNNDSIIFLPTRSNILTKYLKQRWSIKEKGNDIVLLHHSIQLKVNDWKQIRSKLHKEIATIVEHTYLSIEKPRNLREYWYREHKDYLDIREQYETLFLIGSKEIFLNISLDARRVMDEGRDLYLRHPGYHAHEHIDYYERRKHTKHYKPVGWALSLDYYDSELWKR